MYYHPLLDLGIDPTDYYDDLRDMWPDLSHVPCGNDIIGGPVAGLPDNETLSALVADANLTGDDEARWTY